MARVTMAFASMLLVLAACGRTLEPDAQADAAAFLVEPAAGPSAAASERVPWPKAASCAGIVERVLELDRDRAGRLDRATAPLVLATDEQSALTVAGELAIPEAPIRQGNEAPCVLLLGQPTPLASEPDRILGRQTVHSSYQTGSKRRRNPEHQALKDELASARREAERGVDVLATGDPLLDLIGMVAGSVIGGVDAVVTGRELEELEATLDATPAYIEDPVLTPYRYERVDVAAERRFAVPVALHEQSTGAIWSTVITLSEAERFAVVDGRHAKDADNSQAADARSLTSAALAIWHRQAPPLEDRALLTHLAAAIRSGEPARGSLDDAWAMLRQTTAPTAMLASLEPAADFEATERGRETTATAAGGSPVLAGGALAGLPEPAAGPMGSATVGPLLANLVRVGEAELPGFYVSAEHILIPAAALGRSSLLAVRYADGMRAYGLVELIEEELGVALVYLPRPGEALTLTAGLPLPPATRGEPGVPWGTESAVAGVVVEDPETGRRRWIEGAALQRLVGRLDRL